MAKKSILAGCPKPRIYQSAPGGWICRSSKANGFFGATPAGAYYHWLLARQPQVRARILRHVPGAGAVFAKQDAARRLWSAAA